MRASLLLTYFAFENVAEGRYNLTSEKSGL